MLLDKIFISIASYRDLELYPTVENLLQQAEYPQRLYISLFVQDRTFPDFTELFEKYNISGYSYQKADYTIAKGVGYARHMTQKPLKPSFKYYFQIDSHSRLIKNWDSLIISDYKRLSSIWGDTILSTYPQPYTFDENNLAILHDDYVPVLKLVSDSDASQFKPVYFEPEDSPDISDGYLSGYFAGGQSFGLTKYFLDTKYDPDIYFWGEEQTLSIRFFEKGINIICPPRNYLFHDYEGSRRVRHWDSNTIQEMYSSRSKQRIIRFFKGQLEDYGVSDINAIDLFKKLFVS